MHVAERLVNQIQVEVFELQAAQRFVNGLLRALVAGVLYPELAGDKQLLPRHTTPAKAMANRLFVQIGGSGIDQPVARLDSVHHAAFALFGVCNLKDAVANDGHGKAIVQGDVVHESLHRKFVYMNFRQSTGI